MILSLLISIFISPASAAGIYTCQDFFEPGSMYYIENKEHNTNYFNPWDGSAVAEFLSFPKIVQQLQRIDKNKENLGFYEDHAVALADTLQTLNARIDDLEVGVGYSGLEYKNKLRQMIRSNYTEIVLRRTQKKMTYYWFWTISFKVSAIKEAYDNFSSKDSLAETSSMGLIERLLYFTQFKFVDDKDMITRIFLRNGAREISDGGLIFSKGVLSMPVIARLTYSHFLETENTIELISTPLELPVNHGLNRKKYSDSTNHDFTHATRNIRSREMAGPRWSSIHDQIYSKIKELPGVRREYTEYLYGYLLREFLQKRAEIVAFLEWRSNESILDKDMERYLLKRLSIYNDLGQDFPNVKNKQEIIDIGLENLTRILEQMRAGG